MGMIYIMRHGESVVNVERRLTRRRLEGDLTTIGREQILKAAEWLVDKGISTIRCSPFHRAQQSAHIIGDKLNLTPVIDEDLREMDCGRLDGRVDGEAWTEWSSVYNMWLARDLMAAFPEGESYAQGFARLQRALAQVQSEETALMVTHGGIVRTVVPYLCVNAAAMQRLDDLHNTGFVVLEPYDIGRYICWSWNLVEHLD